MIAADLCADLSDSPLPLAVWIRTIAAGATGDLKLDVMGEIGAGAKNQAEVIAPDGKVVATVTPGASDRAGAGNL